MKFEELSDEQMEGFVTCEIYQNMAEFISVSDLEENYLEILDVAMACARGYEIMEYW